MPKTILLVTHRFVPFALHDNLKSEVFDFLPHAIETFQKGDVAEEMKIITSCFEQAKRAGFTTVCLGTEQLARSHEQKKDHINNLPDVSKRLESIGIDYCSGWDTFEWNSYAHDIQMLQECLHIIEEQREESTFICLNLLSCRDTLLLSFFDKSQCVSISVTDDRFDIHPDLLNIAPSTVTQRTKFACAFSMSCNALCSISDDLAHVLSRASECGVLIGMTVLSSFALGEHDYFGSSPMREGTTSFFASNIQTMETKVKIHNESIVETFVTSCMGNEKPVFHEVFPLVTINEKGRRNVFVHNDHLYSTVDGKIFDLHTDPNEENDIRQHLEHIYHMIPMEDSDRKRHEVGKFVQGTKRHESDTKYHSEALPFSRGMHDRLLEEDVKYQSHDKKTDHTKLSQMFPLNSNSAPESSQGSPETEMKAVAKDMKHQIGRAHV